MSASQLDLLPPDQAILISLWRLLPACLSFVVTLVSFIRLLSLPRERKH